MEVFSKHTTVRIAPMFGIISEPFNAMDMNSALGPAQCLADHNVVAPNSQRGIGMLQPVDKVLAKLAGILFIKLTKFHIMSAC